MLTFLQRKTLISTGIGILCACLAVLFLPWADGNSDKITGKARAALESHDFDTLAKLIDKYPSQLGNYREFLTEQLLKAGQTEHEYFVATLKRLQEVSPAQAKVARISMLISKGEFESALEESLSLEQELQKQESSGSLVVPGAIAQMVNRLRIAELYSSLGRFQDEVDAWKKFEELVGWDEQSNLKATIAQNEALPMLEQGFQEQGIDLKEYVRFRKRLALQ